MRFRMDSKTMTLQDTKTQRIKKKLLQWVWIMACLVGLGALSVGFLMLIRQNSVVSSFVSEGKRGGLELTQKFYWHFIGGIKWKVEQIYQLEEENSRFKLENAELRESLENLQFHRLVQKNLQLTQEASSRVSEKTGSKGGQTLEGIAYRPPENLLPFQLYTLGIAYLKDEEYEKAAVVFTQFFEKDKLTKYTKVDSSIQMTKALLAAGVAWYRLNNFVLADDYFTQALKKSQQEEKSKQVQSQVRLWKALVSEKLKKGVHVKYWLNELFEHHPKSEEAALINSKINSAVNSNSNSKVNSNQHTIRMDHEKVSKKN